MSESADANGPETEKDAEDNLKEELISELEGEDVEELDSENEEGESEQGKEDAVFVEEAWGEMPEGGEEGMEEEGTKGGTAKVEEELEEELIEEEPPDPTAPYDLSDSKEALRAPFKLNDEQLQEVKDIWEAFQNYTPAYTDLQEYVTEKELVYMLKALNLQTFTPEQLQELIVYCVRPSNPHNYVYLEHFVHMVTIRQRDMPVEEELRLALEVLDPENTGQVDREVFRTTLKEHGKPVKTLDEMIKEVDMTNDGVLNLEDIVGTICIDLNRDEIDALLNKLYPKEETVDKIDELTASEVPAKIPGARET